MIADYGGLLDSWRRDWFLAPGRGGWPRTLSLITMSIKQPFIKDIERIHERVF